MIGHLVMNKSSGITNIYIGTNNGEGLQQAAKVYDCGHHDSSMENLMACTVNIELVRNPSLRNLIKVSVARVYTSGR